MLTRPTPITSARSSQLLPIGWVPDSAEQAGEGSRESWALVSTSIRWSPQYFLPPQGSKRFE